MSDVALKALDMAERAFRQRDALHAALRQARTMLNAYGSETDPCHVALMDDIDAALALIRREQEHG